ncbi:hypothetical protein Anapl_07876 [Anas platyrhynchos]|uniref:Uncharacterized protein n=1 Tax=Anas platyrhynchos TaxID=8839 RepID=R0LH96_ANAPL|nr:hypothetical protein Anapl_07876 [Anas platyrhynchos]
MDSTEADEQRLNHHSMSEPLQKTTPRQTRWLMATGQGRAVLAFARPPIRAASTGGAGGQGQLPPPEISMEEPAVTVSFEGNQNKHRKCPHITEMALGTPPRAEPPVSPGRNAPGTAATSSASTECSPAGPPHSPVEEQLRRNRLQSATNPPGGFIQAHRQAPQCASEHSEPAVGVEETSSRSPHLSLAGAARHAPGCTPTSSLGRTQVPLSAQQLMVTTADVELPAVPQLSARGREKRQARWLSARGLALPTKSLRRKQGVAATKGKQRHEGCQPALCNLWARACCASDFEGRQHIPQLWMPKPSGVSAGEKPSQDKADVLQQISLRSPAATAPTSPLLLPTCSLLRRTPLHQVCKAQWKAVGMRTILRCKYHQNTTCGETQTSRPSLFLTETLKGWKSSLHFFSSKPQEDTAMIALHSVVEQAGQTQALLPSTEAWPDLSSQPGKLQREIQHRDKTTWRRLHCEC